MQSQSKDKCIYLAALCSLFAIAENALPHLLPFLRLGLANIPLLYALNIFNFQTFMALAFLKWLLSVLFSGLLFSPFGLMSLGSTFSSALIMFTVKKLFKRSISVYGISLFGAMVAAAVQIFLASVYLDVNLNSILPIFLLFSIFSSAITAFVSTKIDIKENFSIEIKDKNIKLSPISFFILISIFFISFNSSLLYLAICFVLSLLLLYLTRKRIKLIPFIMIFLSTVFLSVLDGEGEVLFAFVTREALVSGCIKALTLLTIVALSLTLTYYPLFSKGIISSSISLLSVMMDNFNKTRGSITHRLNSFFSSDINLKQETTRITNKAKWYNYLLCVLIICISVISKI